MSGCERCGLSKRDCKCRSPMASGAIDTDVAKEVDRQFRNAVIDECIAAMNPILRDMISRGQACSILRALKRGAP